MRSSLFLILCASVARADGGQIALESFRPAVDSRGFVSVDASDTLTPRELSFGLVTSWGHGALRLPGYRIDDLITPTLQAAIGVVPRVEIGASVPFHIVSGAFDGQGIGDVAAHLKVKIVKHVAVVGTVAFATGTSSSWMSDGGTEGEGRLVVDDELGRLRLAMEAGVRARPRRTFMSMTTGPSLPAGAAAAWAIVPQHLELVGELVGDAPLASGGRFDLEAQAAVKVTLAHASFFTAGAGLGLAAAAPDVRLFAGIVFEPAPGDRDGDGLKDDVDRCPDQPEDRDGFEDEDGCPDPDNDKDGIPDVRDRCPLVPEDKDGVEDEDGCPENEVADRDHDGIPDDRDRCPDDPEDKDGFEDADGCPDPDNDHDGILDVDDGCPDQTEDKDGFEDADGCPDPDNDHDRIPDAQDRCPNQPEVYNGYQDDDGCPDRTVATRTGTDITVLDNIYFETDKADIRADSFPTLDAIAATIGANPDISLLEIQGHADERGDAGHNLALTQARAESVKAYLVKKGIAASRLVPKGYGATRPKDPGHDEKAWAANRRVEFVIVKSTP